MGFFSKIGSALKKVGSFGLQAAGALGVPGASQAAVILSKIKSHGENQKKLAIAKSLNLKAGPKLTMAVKNLQVGRAPTKIRAPVVKATPDKALAKRKSIREDQVVKLKAGKVPAERQKLLYDEWKALGSPGTWEEYLLDQVRTGAL